MFIYIYEYTCYYCYHKTHIHITFVPETKVTPINRDLTAQQWRSLGSRQVCPYKFMQDHTKSYKSVYLSIYRSIYLSLSLSLSVSLCLSLSLSVSLCLSLSLSVSPCLSVSLRVSRCPSVSLRPLSVCLCPSVCLSVCLSVRPSVSLSICLSICLPICLSIYRSWLLQQITIWSQIGRTLGKTNHKCGIEGKACEVTS